jgi:hypothetical protein
MIYTNMEEEYQSCKDTYKPAPQVSLEEAEAIIYEHVPSEGWMTRSEIFEATGLDWKYTGMPTLISL